MQDTNDINFLLRFRNFVDDEVGSAGNYQFPSSINPPRASEFGKFLQRVDALFNSIHDTKCSITVPIANPFGNIAKVSLSRE